MRFITEPALLEYETAVSEMERLSKAIHESTESERIWLVEHPPLYTAGTSAKPSDLIDSERFPVFETGRGGQYTYHGPGQRVAYVMLDLKKRADAKNESPDLRVFVKQLEEWLIRTLAEFSVTGEIRDGRIGVWVKTGNTEKKIGALGIRVKHWVTYHGIALNVNPDLSHFDGIVPCGIQEYGVTSLHELGIDVSMEDVDTALRTQFNKIFGD